MSQKRPESEHSGKESSASFADYDNDGFLDLYIVREDGDMLYRNSGKGVFEDVTVRANRVRQQNRQIKPYFSIWIMTGILIYLKQEPNSNLLFRNNGDGTFQEQAEKMGLAGSGMLIARDAAFGDFDEMETLTLLL